jgi:hypothetical protein
MPILGHHSFRQTGREVGIRHTVLIGVSTSNATDDFEKQLLEPRFDQNVAFLSEDNGVYSYIH